MDQNVVRNANREFLPHCWRGFEKYEKFGIAVVVQKGTLESYLRMKSVLTSSNMETDEEDSRP
jgi:hypothetical protein